MTKLRKRAKPLGGVQVDLDPPGDNAKLFSLLGAMEVRGKGDNVEEVVTRLSHFLNHPRARKLAEACGLQGIGFQMDKYAEIDVVTKRPKKKSGLISGVTGKLIGGH